MSLPRVHYPHALVLPDGGGTLSISHLDDTDLSLNQQIVTQNSAGYPTICFAAISQYSPQFSFTTTQLKPLVDELITALATDSRMLNLAYGASTLDMWYAAGRPSGFRMADDDTEHIRARFTPAAILYWDSLRARQGSFAMFNMRLLSIYDGAQDSVQFTTGPVTGIAAGCGNLYTLGPVYINSTQVKGITDVNIQSNCTLEQVTDSGNKSVNYISHRDYNPTVMLETNDMTELSSVLPGGTSFTTMEIYFKKMSSADVHEAHGSAVHLKVTAFGGLRYVPGASQSPVVVNPTFQLIDQATSGGNPYGLPLIIEVDQAIP